MEVFRERIDGLREYRQLRADLENHRGHQADAARAGIAAPKHRFRQSSNTMLSRQSAFFLLLGRAANELYHFARLPRARSLSAGMLGFACNFCGRAGALDLGRLEREERTCLGCGSTLRQRSLLAALSRKLLGGRSLLLSDWPRLEQLDVIGVSDGDLVAAALGRKTRYRNTFVHQAPMLNICLPEEQYCNSCDVLVCSDVLEHVRPPVEDALAGMRKIVRPGGFALITVPCTAAEKTLEHFPELHEYRIVERHGTRFLVNRTADGGTQEFGNLVFHGGPGETLEMRRFGLPDLERGLRNAGFSKVEIFAQPSFEHGVYWREPYSVPIIAS